MTETKEAYEILHSPAGTIVARIKHSTDDRDVEYSEAEIRGKLNCEEIPVERRQIFESALRAMQDIKRKLEPTTEPS